MLIENSTLNGYNAFEKSSLADPLAASNAAILAFRFSTAVISFIYETARFPPVKLYDFVSSPPPDVIAVKVTGHVLTSKNRHPVNVKRIRILETKVFLD
jgi:hypothetical protein